MKKTLIFLGMFATVIIIGSVKAYYDYLAAERFQANGVIINAEWNTKNHLMSLFVIKEKYVEKKLHHSRVTLTTKQVKVGDTFKKEKGSKFCVINGLKIQCIK